MRRVGLGRRIRQGDIVLINVPVHDLAGERHDARVADRKPFSGKKTLGLAFGFWMTQGASVRRLIRPFRRAGGKGRLSTRY